MAKACIRIKAAAFNRSIEAALNDPPDHVASAAAIRRFISKLPPGTLYPSDNGNTASFYIYLDGKQRSISKKSDMIHPLARKKYLSLLLEILELTGSTKQKDIIRRQKLISKLQKFITVCEKGNLNLARIVLTKKQYDWFTSQFVRKWIDEKKAVMTRCGIPVRSMAERDILNYSEDMAIPLHYEERMVIYVKPLVDKLEKDLQDKGVLNGRLYDYIGDRVRWNVPPDLEWMNTTGSIWKSYYPPTGKITIYNDFRTMFADRSLFIHEHAGMMRQFRYRCNETERTAVMKITGVVDPEHILETYEDDIDTPEKLIDILEKHVIPRLWF